MENAVATLVEMAKPDRRVAVVGDMLELGKYAKQLHADLGKLLAESGVRRLLAIGRFAQIVADGAMQAGMDRKRIFTAIEAEEAAIMTKNLVEPGDVVLLKGSRGVQLETVFEKF
jgi:UDP-N-acetylmuramoyl-tripeptide--D-alanyl-D-alanine ligase